LRNAINELRKTTMKGLPPTVTSIGGRDCGVRSVGGLIDLQVAAPKEMGGQGDKTNREELFAQGTPLAPTVP
jgi:hypothetical protein